MVHTGCLILLLLLELFPFPKKIHKSLLNLFITFTIMLLFWAYEWAYIFMVEARLTKMAHVSDI